MTSPRNRHSTECSNEHPPGAVQGRSSGAHVWGGTPGPVPAGGLANCRPGRRVEGWGRGGLAGR